MQPPAELESGIGNSARKREVLLCAAARAIASQGAESLWPTVPLKSIWQCRREPCRHAEPVEGGDRGEPAHPEEFPSHTVGPGLAMLMAYLVGACGLSKRRVEEVVETVFELPVALGTVAKVELGGTLQGILCSDRWRAYDGVPFLPLLPIRAGKDYR